MSFTNKLKMASGMLSKVGFELIFDDYEVTIVDCSGEIDEQTNKAYEQTVDLGDDEALEAIYIELMKVYSERIESIKAKRDACIKGQQQKLIKFLESCERIEKE